MGPGVGSSLWTYGHDFYTQAYKQQLEDNQNWIVKALIKVGGIKKHNFDEYINNNLTSLISFTISVKSLNMNRVAPKISAMEFQIEVAVLSNLK